MNKNRRNLLTCPRPHRLPPLCSCRPAGGARCCGALLHLHAGCLLLAAAAGAATHTSPHRVILEQRVLPGGAVRQPALGPQRRLLLCCVSGCTCCCGKAQYMLHCVYVLCIESVPAEWMEGKVGQAGWWQGLQCRAPEPARPAVCRLRAHRRKSIVSFKPSKPFSGTQDRRLRSDVAAGVALGGAPAPAGQASLGRAARSLVRGLHMLAGC